MTVGSLIPSSALTVNFTVGGTAANGIDYNTVGTSVEIPANEPSATVTVTPSPDAAVEGNETVTLTLASGSGYTVGSPNAATVTIADASGGTLKVPSAVRFGQVNVGSSKTAALVISNTHRTQSLVVQINDPTPTPPFSLVSGGGTVTIGPRGSHSVTLRFAPTARGEATGSLVLQSSDPAKPTATVQLSGRGR